jgi:hypothetical protein
VIARVRSSHRIAQNWIASESRLGFKQAVKDKLQRFIQA